MSLRRFDLEDSLLVQDAFIRWAKKKGGTLVNSPSKMVYVEAPESIFVTIDQRIEYHPLQEELINLKRFKEEAIHSMEAHLKNHPNKELSMLNIHLMSSLDRYNEEVLQKWNLLLDPLSQQEKICQIEMLKPDSILAISNFNHVLPSESKIYIIDSLQNQLQSRQFELVNTELLRFLTINAADSLLNEAALDSLAKLEEAIDSMNHDTGKTQVEKEAFITEKLSQIDILLSDLNTEKNVIEATKNRYCPDE